MPVTKEEIESFKRFAEDKLSNGGADTMQQLLDEWNDRREHEQSVADIQESIAQCEAGEGLPVDEAFDEIRNRLGWSE